MNWLHEITNNKSTHDKLSRFLSAYGISGLEQALQDYIDQQQDYICRTKTSVTRLKISDIYYLEIHGHNILVHTAQHTYQKYGTLSKELNVLAHYGFIKCKQNCAISVTKIKSIRRDQITLNNGKVIHMSRNCSPQVLIAFYGYLRK